MITISSLYMQRYFRLLKQLLKDNFKKAHKLYIIYENAEQMTDYIWIYLNLFSKLLIAKNKPRIMKVLYPTRLSQPLTSKCFWFNYVVMQLYEEAVVKLLQEKVHFGFVLHKAILMF